MLFDEKFMPLIPEAGIADLSMEVNKYTRPNNKSYQGW